ncbi:MAG TPA: sialidase family protein [Candidatus Eisenbacteria bacterium]|nr:sialidase family protein [Candidatus Eisenbacteria bacterium]
MRAIWRPLAITMAVFVGLLAGVSPAQAATLNFNSQANLVQASPFPQNKQNEPSIAQNPTNRMQLIAGSNDEIDEPACHGGTTPGCPFTFGVGGSGVYVSNDGGVHWSQFSAPSGGDNTISFNGDRSKIHTLPGFGKLSRDLGIPGLASDGDPAIAFSRDGIAYYGSLAGVRGIVTNSELLTVSRSTDGGQHWSGPVLATDRTNPADFNDKIAIWVDQGATSPFAGTVYVSWTLFQGGPGRAEPIMVSRSTDGGMTFSSAMQVTPAHNNNSIGGRQGSAIRTAPNGDVYVFFESGAVVNGTKVNAQMFVKSTDGGASFSKEAVASTVVDIPSPLPGSSFRNDSFASIDIGPIGNIYVAWADFRSGRGLVMLTTSSDGGGTWTPAAVVLDVADRSAFFPGVAVSPDGSKVSVATQALDAKLAGTPPGAGVVHYDSYFAESVSAGAFSAPLKISTASSDPDGSSTNSLGAQFQGDYNTLISDNQRAWFIWTDASNATPCAAVDVYRAHPVPTKPNVPASCAGTFGNTDIIVGRVSL